MSTAILPIVYVVPTYDAKHGDTCSRSCPFRGSLFKDGVLEWAVCSLFQEPLELRGKAKTLLARLPECVRAERMYREHSADIRASGDPEWSHFDGREGGG